MSRRIRWLGETRTQVGLALFLAMFLMGWAVEIWGDVDHLQDTIARNATLIGRLTQLEEQSLGVAATVMHPAPISPSELNAATLLSNLEGVNEELAAAQGLGSLEAAKSMSVLAALVDSMNRQAASLRLPEGAPLLNGVAQEIRSKSREEVLAIRTRQRELSFGLRREWKELVGLAVLASFCAIVLGLSFVSTQRELVRRKAAERQLREANDRLLQIANNIHEVFWLVSTDKKQVHFVSPAYETVWGKSVESLYEDPHSWLDAIHPEDRQTITESSQKDQMQGDFDWTYRIIRPDGEERWIRDRAFPVRNERGEIYRIAGLAEDVTERIEAERARKESEERYRTLFDMSPDAVLLIQAEGPDVGKILSANRSASVMHGWSVEELQSMNIRDLDTPDSARHVPERTREITENGKAQFEVTHCRKDGSKFPIEVHAVSMVVDGKRRILALDRDITDRKKAERALRASEERYRQLFERDSAGVFYSFFESGEVDCNDAFFRMFGYENKAELLACPRSDLYPSPKHRSDYIARLRRERQIQDLEITLRRKDGTLFEAIENVSLLMDSEGREYIQGTIVDITDRKRAQDALREEQQLLRGIIDGTDDEICVKDENGKYLLCNKGDAHWFYRPTDQLLGLTDRELFPSDVSAEILRRDKEVLTTGRPIEYEQEFPGPDGSKRTYSIRKYPRVGADGKISGVIVISRNVTERLQSERELRDSEKRNRLLIESSPICIQEIDLEGRVRSMNPTGLQMLGVEREDQVVGRLMSEFVAPMDKDRVSEEFRSALMGKEVAFEFQTIHGRIYRKTLVPDYCLSGRVRRLIGWASDITERRVAEDALRDSESRLASVIQNSPGVAVQWYDRQGRVKLWNPASESMFGFTRAEAMGRTLDKLIHTPEEFAGFLKALDDISTTGEPIGPSEFVFHRRDGRTGTCLSTLFKIPGDADGDWFVCMDVDITDRKSAEAAIAESERQYREVFENAHDAILIFDPKDETVLEVNHRACEIYGYTRDEFVGTSLKLISKNVLRGERQIQGTIEAGKLMGFESTQIRRDGQEIDIEINAAVIDYGGRKAILTVNRDVTERKKSEESLRQRERELAHFARVSVMGEMASGFAHELNQPLTAVANYCRGARLRLGRRQVEDPELIAAIDDAGREAHRAAEIIRGLARFVQKRDPRQSKMRVNPTIQEAIVLASAEAKRSRARIELDLALENPTVLADDVQIQQVILNLVRNGLEAMEKLPQSERILKVRTAVVGNCVNVAVSDSGVGLANAEQDQVFQPFFSTKQDGMGMGLPISRSIIDAHGGRMWVTPNVERGVTFGFTLPVTS